MCFNFFVCECSVVGSRKKNFFFEHPYLQLFPVLLCLYGETLTS